MKLFALASCAAAQYHTAGYYRTDYTTIWTTTTSPPPVECGGTITGYETIVSPIAQTIYGVSYYPSDADCVWNIELGANVAGFNIVRNHFDLEYHPDCAFDWLRLEANGDTTSFCGSQVYNREASEKTEEDGKWVIEQENPRPDGLPENLFVPGGSAVLTFHSDGSTQKSGFEFEIVPIQYSDRFNIIKAHAQRVIDSVADEKWGIRYSDRMNKHLDKLAGADTGVDCYDENFPAGEEEEGDEITVFDADNMCKLNGQVNAALNSYARHYACKGRGKVYRQIIRSARKTKKFFNEKNNC